VTVHEIAYGRVAKPQILTKCGRAVPREEAVGFRIQGVDCQDCLTPGAWPTAAMQKAVDFTAPGGHAFDKGVSK
jgi:hypothetical protein